MRVPELSEKEWEAIWMLLYNVCVNNLVSPYVGNPRDNVRGGLRLFRESGETVLDPLSLEQLLVLEAILTKVSEAGYPEEEKS